MQTMIMYFLLIFPCLLLIENRDGSVINFCKLFNHNRSLMQSRQKETLIEASEFWVLVYINEWFNECTYFGLSQKFNSVDSLKAKACI